ncbi:MAG: DUF3179 domain-containing protein, partial [Cyclobacteriaceae bacterium]|nr:DUF3179 domain-containing protein [Cyclobacteriaceae bacterium]
MTFNSIVINIANFILITTVALLVSCDDNSTESGGTGGGGTNGGGANGNGTVSPDWLIPLNEVLDGGPGKDGIPALENPENKGINQITFLSDNDLVVGFQFGDQVRAYPHKILDWHEIINDELNGKKVAITYCPLTGTGIAWSRNINGKTTTFGVSGLLYNSNLIPYDRLTDSNWSQLRLDCVNGQLLGDTIETFHLVETKWKTWKEMFPNSSVVTSNTGYGRDYNRYPYGDYKTNNSKLLFPVTPKDDRLAGKERVLGLILNGKAKVYRFSLFEKQTKLIHFQFEGKNLIVIGSRNKNFIVAFENNLNGEERTFTAIDEGENIMQDDKGNKYNLFGMITDGVDKGNKLASTTSFMGYWFSFGAFYS